MEHPTKEEVIEYFKNAKRIHFNGYVYKDLPPCEFDISTLRHTDTEKEEEGFFCDEALGIDDNSDILMYDHVTRKYADIIEYKEPSLKGMTGIDKDILNSSKRPTRYASREVNGMDVIDLIEYWDLDFCRGNILKYLLRLKNEDKSDLEKIIDYAQRKLKQLKNDK